MNNVETFASVPAILGRGAAWWKDQGVNGGEGLKFFSVSGHVERPGVFCVPSGTTVGEVIELAGGIRDGAALGAVQPGGASTNFLGPDCLDVPLTFDGVAKAGSALGTGAMVVMAEGTDLLEASTTVLKFFRNESCGKCVPCRVGSNKAARILTEDPRARRERGGRRRADRPARGDAAAHVDLRSGPGRARPRHVRAADAARRRPPPPAAGGRDGPTRG
jgi:NADH:ubiquinone oxidoreductase subunit F (NADH-binding)